MKFFKTVVFGLSLFVLLLSDLYMFGASQAQTTSQQSIKPIKIAVLNLKVIRQNAKVVGSIRQQIKKYQDSFLVEIKKEEDELRNANQALARKRSLLSPEAFVDERRKFEQRVVTIQRLVQQRKIELDRVKGYALSQVELKLNEIVDRLSKERNFDLILRGSQAIFATKQLNITVEVLQLLDKQMKTISVPNPGQKN